MSDNVEPEGKQGKQRIYAAVLVGVISTNQFQSSNPDTQSKKREQMSDQVVSRVVPVMKWIKMHIEKDHVCIPKTL